MVGSEVIRQAIADNGITEVTALVRKPLNIQHEKLKTVIHKDFLNYSGLEDVFKNNDACLWCLGISQNLVSKEDYFTITYDYAVNASKAMLLSNPRITFLFLSGDGAATSEKSLMLFGRVKGKTENALQKVGMKKFYITRPGGIYPVNEDPHITFYLKLQNRVVRLMKFLAPWVVITSVDLAKAMLAIVKKGGDKVLFTHAELKEVAKGLPASDYTIQRN